MSEESDYTTWTRANQPSPEWMRQDPDMPGQVPVAPDVEGWPVSATDGARGQGPSQSGGSGDAVPPGRLQGGSAVIAGQARGIQSRTESSANGEAMTIWAFRIERYDSAGNRLRPVAVEMRGRGFQGSLHEGDDVRVSGTWKDGTLRSQRIDNLTTHALVRAKPFPWKPLLVFLTIVLIVVIAFAVFVIRSFATSWLSVGNAAAGTGSEGATRRLRLVRRSQPRSW
jgi:hypothetical protein